MGTIPVSTLTDSIVVLLTEAYVGPSDPSATWFIDNAPDAGVLGVIAGMSALEASTSVDGTDAAGSTIAAIVEHLRWSLANANGAFRGQPYNPNWAESWALISTDDAKWEQLRSSLRAEFDSMVAVLKQQDELQDEYLNGLLALIPHAAYHLGVIRQMIARLRKAY